MKIQIIFMSVFLSGCFGLPKRGVIPNELQIKKCERIVNIAVGMYEIGCFTAFGSAVYGFGASEFKVAPIVFLGSFGIGITGLGLLYYMEKQTSCPIP